MLCSSSSCVWYTQPKVVGQLFLFDLIWLCSPGWLHSSKHRADQSPTPSMCLRQRSGGLCLRENLTALENLIGETSRKHRTWSNRGNFYRWHRILFPVKCSECQCDIKVMHVKNHMQRCGHQFRKGSSLFTHTLQVDCEERGQEGETRAVWSHYNMSQSLLPCEIISPACASPFNQSGSCFR